MSYYDILFDISEQGVRSVSRRWELVVLRKKAERKIKKKEPLTQANRKDAEGPDGPPASPPDLERKSRSSFDHPASAGLSDQ